MEVIDLRVFGRRIINTAKHFFAQKLRDVERNYIYEDYANRVGEIVIGVVHQVQRDNVFINIDPKWLYSLLIADLVLIIIFPQIALWLPGYLYGQ